MADAAQPRLLPTRVHVHDLLRIPHLPELIRRFGQRDRPGGVGVSVKTPGSTHCE